jgi:hypothetical protein
MKNSFFKIGLGLFVFLSCTGAYSAPLEFGIEPIIGYERIQKIRPDRHARNRLFYGARVRLGIPLLSLEAELTQADDSEEIPAISTTIKDTDYRLKVGARSAFKLTSLLRLVARAGGQAAQNINETTVSGVTTRTVGSIVYKPYAGVGLISSLWQNFFLSGGITVVFNDFPNMDSNDYQSYLGFIVRLP